MVLCLDIGNTNIEFGVFKDDKLIEQFRLSSKNNLTSDEIGLLITHFFDVRGICISEIDDVLIASVVPQVIFSIVSAIKKYISKTPILINEDLKVPVIKVSDEIDIKEVGADRLVNSYEAFKLFGGPVIVLDFGTATTYDIVSKNGVFIGGCIAPGIKISMDALTKHAAMLPTVEILKPNKVIATDTITNIQAGALYGFVGATEKILNAINDELGEKAFVVATGGLCSIIADNTNLIDKVDKTLTLYGIYDSYRYYK